MNVLIINAHEPFGDIAKGELTQAFIDVAKRTLTQKGYDIMLTETRSDKGYDVAEELEKHRLAERIILQTPMYWMGLPWSFKKYIDEVYTQGMNGELCLSDGCVLGEPDKQYGSGGTRQGVRYLLSVTMNAPKEAFNDPNQWFMTGKSVDDLFYPQHQNFRFFGMTALPTFVAYDVIKNAQIEADLVAYEAHLNRYF